MLLGGGRLTPLLTAYEGPGSAWEPHSWEAPNFNCIPGIPTPAHSRGGSSRACNHCLGRHEGLSWLSKVGVGSHLCKRCTDGEHIPIPRHLFIHRNTGRPTHPASQLTNGCCATGWMLCRGMRGDQGWDGGFMSQLNALSTCSFAQSKAETRRTSYPGGYASPKFK